MLYGYPVGFHVLLQLVAELNVFMTDTTAVFLRTVLWILSRVFCEGDLVPLQQVSGELDRTSWHLVLAEDTFLPRAIAPLLHHGGKVLRLHLDVFLEPPELALLGVV